MEEELFESKTNMNDILAEMHNMEEEMKGLMLENERMHEVTRDARKAIYRSNKESPID